MDTTGGLPPRPDAWCRMVRGWLPEQADLVHDAEVIDSLLSELADQDLDVDAFGSLLELRQRDPRPSVAEGARRIQQAWQHELAEAAGAPLMAKPRVLVIDDEEPICELMADVLGRRFAVTIATSGTEALAQARAQPPALVVLDVMMPDLDGYEVARRLRAEPATAGVRILFCTARGGLNARMLGREVGGDDYIVKPFQWHRLAAQAATMVGMDPLGA
jgi:PleD family two-component response regulator